MKDIKTLHKEVDKSLQEKVSALDNAFSDDREKQFLILVSLYEELRKLEDKKKELLTIQGTEAKNFIPSNKTLNECGFKLNRIEKSIREVQKQIDTLFAKLTTIPESVREIYPFIKLLG